MRRSGEGGCPVHHEDGTCDETGLFRGQKEDRITYIPTGPLDLQPGSLTVALSQFVGHPAGEDQISGRPGLDR